MKQELPEFDLEGYLPYQITAVATRLSTDLEKHYKEQFGLSIPEWRVLVNVGYAKDNSVRDIEKRVRLGKSKVSRASSSLASKGLITKVVDPIDRRLVMLALTSNGVQVLVQMVPVAKAFQDSLKQKLDGDFSAFQATLEKLLE